MNESRNNFVPLDMSEFPLLEGSPSGSIPTKNGVRAYLPSLVKGKFVEFDGVRWEVVKVGTMPPRLVLKPCGPSD